MGLWWYDYKGYAIIQKVTLASGNTTLNVQVPEGNGIPAIGSITAIHYCGVRAPYGMPVERGKWVINVFAVQLEFISIGSINTWWASNLKINVPVGKWRVGIQQSVALTSTVSGIREGDFLLTTAAELPANLNSQYKDALRHHVYALSGNYNQTRYIGFKDVDISTPTDYILYGGITSATGSEQWYYLPGGELYAENGYL